MLLEDRSIISKNKRNSFKRKIPIGGHKWEKLELLVRLSIVNLLWLSNGIFIGETWEVFRTKSVLLVRIL